MLFHDRHHQPGHGASRCGNHSGRPPVKAMMSAVQKKAYNLTLGSTPAIMENAIASGMGAKAAAMPASTLIHRIHRPAEHKLVVYLMGVSLG
jgi:hypothetical protein